MIDVPRPGQRVLVTAVGSTPDPRTVKPGEVHVVEAAGVSLVHPGHGYVVLEGEPVALSTRGGDRWLVDPACVGIWNGQATA